MKTFDRKLNTRRPVLTLVGALSSNGLRADWTSSEDPVDPIDTLPPPKPLVPLEPVETLPASEPVVAVDPLDTIDTLAPSGCS